MGELQNKDYWLFHKKKKKNNTYIVLKIVPVYSNCSVNTVITISDHYTLKGNKS
jgi:hypothetical protein